MIAIWFPFGSSREHPWILTGRAPGFRAMTSKAYVDSGTVPINDIPIATFILLFHWRHAMSELKSAPYVDTMAA